MDYRLAGARLIELKYGLVADLPPESPYTTTPYTMPYYMVLEFRREVKYFSEFYWVDDLTPKVYLQSLGKILKHKHQLNEKDFYTFTDDSIMTIG